jgi:chromosome segregation ATPase
VESRFSTLSLRQAKLEELLKQTSEKDDQSLAQIQVNLKKLEDRVKGVGRNLASKKDLDTKVDAIQKKIDNVSNAMDENQANVTQINSQMQTKLSQMGETLENRDNRIAQLETQLAGLDQEKIDKSALDLAISLEALKIKQSLKSQLDDIDARLKALETRIKTQSRSVPAPRSIPSKPIPSVKPQQPSSPSPAEGSVKEQPIQ